MDTLNLKIGKTIIATIKVTTILNTTLKPILCNNVVRFVGTQQDNGSEVMFVVGNRSEFDLTIDIHNMNDERINKINLLRPFETITISRNEVLGCAMVLDEYLNPEPLMFQDEKKRCLGTIKVGFDRSYGKSHEWVIGTTLPPIRRTECDGWCGSDICTDGISSTSRALLKAGRVMDEVKSSKATTSDKFNATIQYDFGIDKVKSKANFYQTTKCDHINHAMDKINHYFTLDKGRYLLRCTKCMDDNRLVKVDDVDVVALY